jgi:hypothetical protein
VYQLPREIDIFENTEIDDHDDYYLLRERIQTGVGFPADYFMWDGKLLSASLDASVEKRTGYTAVDAIGFDRDQPSRHYSTYSHYCVRALKLVALVNVETLYITDVHSMTG